MDNVQLYAASYSGEFEPVTVCALIISSKMGCLTMRHSGLMELVPTYIHKQILILKYLSNRGK